MLSCNEKITLRQLQILIILSAMGTGLIVLPRRVAEYAGRDGWMIVLGLTVVGMGCAALITAAARVKPGVSFVGYTGFALTRPVAYFFGFLLWVKLVLAAGLELRSFLVITQLVLLKDTPVFIVSLVMLVVCAYAAIKGIETRARVAEVLAFVLVLPFVFLFVIALVGIDWDNLQPVLTTPPERLLSGTLRLGFIFTGLECLLLVAPFITKGKNPTRAAVGAVGVAGLIITAVTVITLAKFGTGIADEPWPVLRMMDMLRLPGSFIGRQEALMFSFWIVTVFMFTNALLFFGGVLLADVFQMKIKRKRFSSRVAGTLITAVFVFAVTCLRLESAEIFERLDGMYYTSGVFFMVVFPLLVLLGGALRKRVGKIKNTGVTSMWVAVLLAVPLVSLTGCYDGIEIENRHFVVAIGVDKAEENDNKKSDNDNENNNDSGNDIDNNNENDSDNENESSDLFTISALLSHNNKNNNDTENDEEKNIKKASAKTITEAKHKLNEEANQRLYYGQAKVIILGQGLLDDADLLKNTLNVFTQNTEINRQIYILTVEGKAADAMKENLHEKIDTADAVNFSLYLEQLHTQINQSGCSLIPKHPGSAVAVKNYTAVDTLNADEVRGFLWCLPGENKNKVITARYNGTYIPFTVDKHDVAVSFAKSNPAPQVIIKVTAKGHFAEHSGISEPLAKLLVENEITNEITKTVKKMQDKNADIFHWKEYMQKKQYDLYKSYGYRWECVFSQLEIVPVVTVE
jgi:spore germination protein